jgi:putative restriction endonuclease
LEKEALIRARRGHGRYRQDLERIEIGCRLTGVIDRRHLRASHIKPWCVSNDDEKRDPNNGVLLSPHIDHLFDRGYISFTDAGDLLVSKYLNPVVLSDWGLKAPIKPKPFNAKQCVYLACHRNLVFEKYGRGKESDEREASEADYPLLREIIPGSG